MSMKSIATSFTMCVVAVAILAHHAIADAGQVLLQLDIYPRRTLAHPEKDLIYVTHTSGIIAIDTVNHVVAATVELTGLPRGMALSEDGETLFVADTFYPRLIVLDAHLKQSPVFIRTEASFSSLAMGLNGRLFATRATSSYPQAIYELNSATGETNQTIIANFSIHHGGRLAITPDRTQLWWMKSGGSPSRLAAFDISSDDVTVMWVSHHTDFGSNGQYLAMSWNGDRVSPCNAAPYIIPTISTETFETVGQINTGPYPRSAAYSPDDLVLYASHHFPSGPLTQWDATNYTLIGTIPFVGRGTELNVDRTGRVLVAGFIYTYGNTSGLRLIDTGRSVEKSIHFDIRPGSCPNPLNRESQGIVPTAILGTDDLDVSEIDTGTLAIRRADGIGGSVAPLHGPPGPGIVIEDVGTPVGDDDECQCHDAGPDGIDDLAVKFRTQDLVAELELDHLSPGQSVNLVIEGALLDGTAFSGTDCVVLVGGGAAQHVLTLLRQWGTCDDPLNCPTDLNGDGATDVLDLFILFSNW